MCIFLSKEQAQLEQAIARFTLIQNLQVSKKTRAKRRVLALLSSKRGLSAVFFAGITKTALENSKKHRGPSNTKKVAKLGARTWLKSILAA